MLRFIKEELDIDLILMRHIHTCGTNRICFFFSFRYVFVLICRYAAKKKKKIGKDRKKMNILEDEKKRND